MSVIPVSFLDRGMQQIIPTGHVVASTQFTKHVQVASYPWFSSKGLLLWITVSFVHLLCHRATAVKITGYYMSHLHSCGTCQCEKWWLWFWGHRNHLHNRNIHQEWRVADADQLAEILLYEQFRFTTTNTSFVRQAFSTMQEKNSVI